MLRNDLNEVMFVHFNVHSNPLSLLIFLDFLLFIAQSILIETSLDCIPHCSVFTAFSLD